MATVDHLEVDPSTVDHLEVEVDRPEVDRPVVDIQEVVNHQRGLASQEVGLKGQDCRQATKHRGLRGQDQEVKDRQVHLARRAHQVQPDHSLQQQQVQPLLANAGFRRHRGHQEPLELPRSGNGFGAWKGGVP